MSRESVLKAIGHACAKRDPDATPLPGNIPPSSPIPQPQERFRRELEAVEGRFLDARPASGRTVASALEEVLAATKADAIHWECGEALTDVGLGADPGPESLFARDRLIFSRHPEGRVLDPIPLQSEEHTRSRLEAIQVVVSQAAWGIAETGTVVHQTTPGTGRLLSILPPNHVILLGEDRLLENHLQFFQRHQMGAEGSATLLITGPSRTADIEKQLVTGVHGPRRLFVILTPAEIV